MPDSKLFRLDHFQYRGDFFPLDIVGLNTFDVSIQTTFGLRKTLVVNAASSSGNEAFAQENLGAQQISGFVAFDLEVPFDWTNLTGHRREGKLTDDDDVNICMNYHQFAERQWLAILERDNHKYLMKVAWQVEEIDDPATAFGWFSFSGITLYVDDKIYGARRRQLIEQFGEDIPKETVNTLDGDIRQSAWEVLIELAPRARSQYEEPTVIPGNICRFKLKPN